MPLKDTVKPWFETGDYPTQAQFYAFFDSIRWNDEPINLADLSATLQAAINSIGSNVQEINTAVPVSIAVLAKQRLVNIAVQNNGGANMTITVGTTDGGSQLASKLVNVGNSIDIDLGITFFTNTTIYVGGITGNVKLLIDRK